MEVSPQQQRMIDDLCRRYRVRTLRMFGSAAVGRESPASDVDLAFVGILDNPYRRRAIEPQLRPLFAAAAGA